MSWVLYCESLPGGLRGKSQWNIHQLYRHELSESWSLLIGWCSGQESLVHVAGPVVNHGVALSGFAALLFLQLKHY